MEKQTSDEYSSRLSNYDKLVLGDLNGLDVTIAGMSNPQLIEFFEYCQEKVREDTEYSDLYWLASVMLEETDVVRMYMNGQLYGDDTFGSIEGPQVVKVTSTEAAGNLENPLTEEDVQQINEILTLLDKRKKEKKNPFKQLIKNIKGR